MKVWLRRTGKVMLGLLALVVVVVSLPFVVALFPGGRAFILDKGLEQANANLPLRISVGSLDRLDPWGVDVAKISVKDLEGKQLANLDALSVRLSPFALVAGRLHLTRLHLTRGYADVPALTAAFTSSPEEPKAEEQPASEGGLDYQLDELAVRNVKALVVSGDRLLSTEVVALRAGGAYGSRTSLVLSQLDGTLHDAQGLLARITTRTADFDLEEGGHVEIAGSVADSQLLLRAEVGAIRDDGSWPDGKAHLALTHVSRSALERLGVSGFTLQRPLDVVLDASQKDEKFEVALSLADAARTLLTVSAHGAIDDAAVDLALSPLALAELAPELPEMTVRGKLAATFEGELDDAAWTLAWSGVQLDQTEVPAGKLRGELGATRVDLAALELAGFEEVLRVEAAYDWERAYAELALALKSIELASVPDLRKQGLGGRVRADIALEGKLDGALEGSADVLVENLRQATTRLSRAQLQADFDGTLERPEGKAKARLVKLEAGDVRVDDAAFDVKMEDGQLVGSFRVRAPEGTLDGQARGRQRDATRSLDLSARGKVKEQPIALVLTASDTTDKETVARVELSTGTQTLVAQGSLSANDRVHAKVDAHDLDVAFWGDMFGQEGLRGTVSLTANVTGKLDKPTVAAQVLGHDLGGFGQPDTDLQLSARAELAARRYALTMGVYGRTDPLRVELTADAVLPARAKTTVDWLEGPFEAHAVVHVPASRLASFDDKNLAPLRGNLDLTLDTSGAKGEFETVARVEAEMRLPTSEDDHMDRFVATLEVDQKRAKLDAVAHDRDGELLQTHSYLRWPNDSLFAATSAEAWKKVPTFRVSARLDDRRLDMIQGVYAYLAGLYEMDMPLRVGTNVEVVGKDGELSGAINGRAMLLADVLDPSCALGSQIQSSFDISLDKGVAHLTLWAREAKGGTVRAEVNQKLTIEPDAPPESWLGALEASAEGHNITLRSLPGMCELSSGRAAFVARASALGGRVPLASLELGVEDLRSGDKAEPVALQLNAALTAKQLAADGQLDVQNKKRGTFSVSAPVVTQKDAFAPELTAKTPITARLDVKQLPVAPFLGIGDAVGRPSGHLDASLRVTGPLEKPRPKGFIVIDDVSMMLSSSAQPLRHMNGRIEIDDHRLVVKGLSARDGEGVLKVDGEATYKDDGTGQGRLSLRADEMPLRRQGEIIGELSIRTNVSARVPPSHLAEIEVKIEEGRIWLTGDTGRVVQSLEPNPDVRFVDVPQKEREAAEEEEATDEKPKMGFASMTIRTSERDLWIMHESFSVQVGLDLRFVQEEVPVLRGEVALRRGELQILGKLFSVQRGAIRLTGDAPPDPELDIRAVHKLPSGKQLIVVVSGRSTAPVIGFEGAATNAGEAVALLSGVGRSGAETKAQDDARNFATNLTAGLLTVAARREFGDWVPVLGIENDESGAVSGARAGFDATELIPKPLRGFARAAYVEGIVGSTEESGGNVGVGVKIEVVLPADIVTSWGYGPGATWSTDVAWVP